MSDAAKPNSTKLAVLIPFGIVTLIWGSTWIVIADQLGVVPPTWSVTYRFLLAGITMAAWAAIKRETFWLPPRGLAFAAALGLFQFVLNFNFVYRAEAHVTSGLVAVVFALLLVPNSILGRIFLGQRLGRQLILGSVIAVAGIALLFVHEIRRDPSATDEVLLGIGLTLVGVMSASCANVMQASQTAKAFPMTATIGWAMLIGAAADALFAFATVGPPVIEWRLGYLAGVAYLGIFASALAFSLYFGVIRAIGPAKAAYSSVLIPVLAMFFSTLFEGYRWSLLAGAGALLAGIGLVIALRARRPNR
ncbi:DMT family transporter [Sphingomonas turrisvirgatae]|uniref:Multidrug transporter n=1 Tax=Sphingomonas turrisvirgatae TaxID=1888892 RepID=A0A1E3LQN4_9SPHN|nr:EamA family transporter [Sphingomonas turrisvirgatae]ODP36057.1 multidrug transporter [Sphingomonas turrisvirgatae]